jgi:hypothetical protein
LLGEGGDRRQPERKNNDDGEIDDLRIAANPSPQIINP